MARIFQTGGEMGHADYGDISAGTVQTDQLRGSWSAYSFRGGTVSWDSAVSEFYFGYGYRGNLGLSMLQFESPNGTANVTTIVNGTSNKIEVRRGNSGQTLLATGTTVFNTTTWYYIEGHFTINDSTGVVEIKINGVSETLTFVTGNSTNQDTRNDAAAGGDTCSRMSFGGDSNIRFDDCYVNDTTGSQNTGYSGDIRISAYIPNAAGDTTGLTRGGSDSGSNFGQVDERPPNDATDYVFGTDTTSLDLYNIPNTSGVSDVQAVTLWLRASKSDAGSGNIAHVLKSGGTQDVGSDLSLSTSWTYKRKNYNVDPTDSAAWTPSKIDGLQVGAKSR